jgi:molybdopterin-binding protein
MAPSAGYEPVSGEHDQQEASMMRLSARNQFRARVTAITAGDATANVELDAGGVRMVAAITTEAARELNLTEGREVIAMIKASDVLLAVLD